MCRSPQKPGHNVDYSNNVVAEVLIIDCLQRQEWVHDTYCNPGA